MRRWVQISWLAVVLTTLLAVSTGVLLMRTVHMQLTTLEILERRLARLRRSLRDHGAE